MDPSGRNWDIALTSGGIIEGGLLAGGTSFGIGTVLGATAGGSFGHALGSWIDDMEKRPTYNMNDPRRYEQMQDIVDKTREMDKKTTKSVCNLGAVGKF